MSFKNNFMRGLLFVIPIAVTIWSCNLIIGLVDQWLGQTMTWAVSAFLPPQVEQMPGFQVALSVISLLLLCVVLLGLGKIASYRMGKEGMSLVDHLFIHIPGVNAIYRSTQKMVEAFGDGGAGSFKRCVYLRFPSTHYTLGFVTKEAREAETGRKLLIVFVPTGPNPTGGFTQIVAEEDTIASDISPEEGLKIVISMGVLAGGTMPRLS